MGCFDSEQKPCQNKGKMAGVAKMTSTNALGNRVKPRISTTEATFQCHIIDSTIFQTNSFDFLSEFA